MSSELAGQLLVWAIILTIVVGLPALLRRSRIRSWRRNQAGACARCGEPLGDRPGGYMEGFRLCLRCGRRERRSTIVALTFFIGIGVLNVAIGLGVLIGAPDRRVGAWVIATGLGMIGFCILIWKRTQAANRRAAAKDSTVARIYDPDDSFEP